MVWPLHPLQLHPAHSVGWDRKPENRRGSLFPSYSSAQAVREKGQGPGPTHPASGVGGEEGGILFPRWDLGPTKCSLLLPDERTGMQQPPPSYPNPVLPAPWCRSLFVGERREAEAPDHLGVQGALAEGRVSL